MASSTEKTITSEKMMTPQVSNTLIQHRGRLQVQGNDINQAPSFPWARNDAVKKAEAHRELANLENGCTRSQLRLRDIAFQKAHKFIKNGPVAAPVIRPFQNRNLPAANKNARVDIEVILGIAFV
jgi:hypothetical protein